jgi:pimeloyl-ACP methyl ester carboxylesterase
MLLLNTAHCALEYHRWAVRSIPRPDGIRYANRMKSPVHAPVLHLQGGSDPVVLPSSARGSHDFVAGPYQYCEIPAVGHFPHEEDPQAVHTALLEWLASS